MFSISLEWMSRVRIRVDAEGLEDLADARRRQALPSLFLVLAAVRVGGKHDGDLQGAGLEGRVHRDEEAHDMVVHRQDLGLVRLLEREGVAVGHVLHDVDVGVPHGGEDLRLELAVGKARVLGRHQGVARAVLVHGLVEVPRGGEHVVGEVYLPDHLGPRQAVGAGKGAHALLHLLGREGFQVGVNGLGECHPPRAGENADLRLAGVRHVRRQSTRWSLRAPLRG